MTTVNLCAHDYPCNSTHSRGSTQGKFLKKKVRKKEQRKIKTFLKRNKKVFKKVKGVKG